MWIKLGDEAPESFKFSVLGRSPLLFFALVGSWVCLLAATSRARSNGFMTAAMAARWTTPRLLALLTTSVNGRAPLLHKRGEKCRCLDVHRGRWPDHFTHLLHDYLDHNPDATEAAVKTRQAAERDDRALRRAVRGRDRDVCRYCLVVCNDKDTRGGTGLQLDHVDPALANGAANLVVACRACNTRKGRRTPEEAGMRLRTVEEAHAAADHGRPRPDHGAGKYPATDGTGRDQEEDDYIEQMRADLRHGLGPPPIDRTSDHPNPYHRRPNRTRPEYFAGLPEVDEDE